MAAVRLHCSNISRVERGRKEEEEEEEEQEQGEDNKSRPSCYREIRIWVGRQPVVHGEMEIKPVN